MLCLDINTADIERFSPLEMHKFDARRWAFSDIFSLMPLAVDFFGTHRGLGLVGKPARASFV